MPALRPVAAAPDRRRPAGATDRRSRPRWTGGGPSAGPSPVAAAPDRRWLARSIDRRSQLRQTSDSSPAPPTDGRGRAGPASRPRDRPTIVAAPEWRLPAFAIDRRSTVTAAPDRRRLAGAIDRRSETRQSDGPTSPAAVNRRGPPARPTDGRGSTGLASADGATDRRLRLRVTGCVPRRDRPTVAAAPDRPNTDRDRQTVAAALTGGDRPAVGYPPSRRPTVAATPERRRSAGAT